MFEDFTLNVQLDHIHAKIPTRANDSDAGLDLYTPIDVIVPARGDVLVPLGIRVAFPEGYVMIVQEKSGVATKKKLDLGAKIIDAGYRGICHVHLFNNSDDDVIFAAGDKIAQALVVPCWTGQPVLVDELCMDTTRGTGGFGSTGDR